MLGQASAGQEKELERLQGIVQDEAQGSIKEYQKFMTGK